MGHISSYIVAQGFQDTRFIYLCPKADGVETLWPQKGGATVLLVWRRRTCPYGQVPTLHIVSLSNIQFQQTTKHDSSQNYSKHNLVLTILTQIHNHGFKIQILL